MTTMVEFRVRLLPFTQRVFATFTTVYQVLHPVEGFFANQWFMLAVYYSFCIIPQCWHQYIECCGASAYTMFSLW